MDVLYPKSLQDRYQVVLVRQQMLLILTIE
jgi:hypothetical protein